MKLIKCFIILGTISCISLTVQAGEVLVGIPDRSISYENSETDWHDKLIKDQSFDTDLTEYNHTVYFASCYNEKDAAFHIVEDDEVVYTFESYIPNEAKEQMFKSVDAVCFEDYDDDGDTDIIIVKSWENYTTAIVYEGQELQAKDKFWLNQALSEELTYNLDEINISNIFDYLNYDEENIPDGIMPYDAVRNYGFSSGAGAWGVGMELYSDGTFDVQFHDTDMGGVGDGIHYYCAENSCTGRFGSIIQLSETVYEMTLVEYNPEIEVGTTWTDDECVHEATDVRGIFPGTTFHLYLPGTPVDEMPEGAVNWLMTAFTDDNCLIGTIIYNDDTGAVFTGNK